MHVISIKVHETYVGGGCIYREVKDSSTVLHGFGSIDSETWHEMNACGYWQSVITELCGYWHLYSQKNNARFHV